MSSGNHELHQIIELIYDAAINPEQWPDLLDSISAFIERCPANNTTSSTVNNSSTIKPETLSNILSHVQSIPDSDSVTRNILYQGILLSEVNYHLSRHFHRALSITKKLVEKDTRNSTFEMIVDSLPMAMFVVDGKRNIIGTNKLGNELLKSGSCLIEKSNILTGINARTTRQLQQSINDLLSDDQPVSESNLHLVTDASDIYGNLIALLYPIRSHKKEISPSVGIFITCRKFQPLKLPNSIARLYQLTKKEIKVTEELVKGKSIKEISQAFHVTENTLRSQLKSIFLKTNTSRQAGLVSLVLTGPGSLVGNATFIDELLKRPLKYSSKLRTTQKDKYAVLTDGRHLCYREYGSPVGIPVFYFHSVLGSRIELTYNDNNQAIKRGIRLIAADRPSFGGSDLKKKRTILSWANDVEELADILEIQRFSILSYALGGQFALACAHQMPTRVVKLFMISIGDTPDTAAEFKNSLPLYHANLRLARDLPGIHNLVCAIMRKGIKSNPQQMLTRFLNTGKEADNALTNSDDFKQFLIDNLSEAYKQGSECFAHEVQLYMSPLGFELSDISIPVELWHGDQDQHVPIILNDKMTNKLNHVKRRIVENENHFLLFNQWESILDSVADGQGEQREGR